MEDLRAAGYNPLSQGIFIVLDRRKGRVLPISTDKRAAREVLGTHKGHYIMIELLSEKESTETGGSGAGPKVWVADGQIACRKRLGSAPAPSTKFGDWLMPFLQANRAEKMPARLRDA